MKKKKKFVRKKSRSRRHLVRQLPGKWKIAIIAAASVMFICTFCIFYVVLGSYDGLGMKEAVSENAYDMDYLMEKDGRLYYVEGVYHAIAVIDVSY